MSKVILSKYITSHFQIKSDDDKKKAKELENLLIKYILLRILEEDESGNIKNDEIIKYLKSKNISHPTIQKYVNEFMKIQ